MLRRQTRERRQYAQERQTYERKQQLKDALATGKSLSTELKKDAKQPASHIDNEYARADPSSKLLQFAKEIRLVFPNSHRLNRGNYVVKELADACRANEVTDLISSTVSEQYPHLIFENFTSKLGERIRDVLKYLFPVPKEDSSDHHVFVKIPRQVQLAEVGPRFDMKPYEIRQGTFEQTEAEREWVLAHYARTSRSGACFRALRLIQVHIRIQQETEAVTP
ncbi:anticodon-binding protein [Mycena sp. CBHHK59/15]|nr:anticodon-binding protein [Mycena sp. CBHHK59/15]